MILDLYNEEALDALASMIEPASKIFSDTDVASAVKEKNYIIAIKVILEKHKKETIELLAIANGQKPSEYKANILEMTKQLMALFNNKELMEVFSWQSEENGATPSISAMESTKVTEVI